MSGSGSIGLAIAGLVIAGAMGLAVFETGRREHERRDLHGWSCDEFATLRAQVGAVRASSWQDVAAGSSGR